MNKETILAKVMKMKYEEDDCNGVMVWKNMYNELVEALKADIRDENNRKTGRAKPAKLGKAILARGQKMQKNSGRTELMAYAYTDDKGIKWVLDGYRIAGFFEDVDLPEIPDEDRERWYNVKRLVYMDYDDTEMIYPSVGELKASIKIAKAEKKECQVMFDNGIIVNAQFLLDYLEGFENVKIYAYAPNGKVTKQSPLYITADNGVGVLLPIKNDKLTEPGIHIV